MWRDKSLEYWLENVFPGGMDRLVQRYDIQADANKRIIADACQLEALASPIGNAAFERAYGNVRQVCNEHEDDRIYVAYQSVGDAKRKCEEVLRIKQYFLHDLLPTLKKLESGVAANSFDYSVILMSRPVMYRMATEYAKDARVEDKPDREDSFNVFTYGIAAIASKLYHMGFKQIPLESVVNLESSGTTRGK